MLKTLTLSLSLAVALGVCSVSKAGGLFHNDCAPSEQCPVVSPQCPSPQSDCAPVTCGKKKCHLFENLCGMGNKMSCGFNNFCCKMKPKPPVYCYEWVLKKKRVWCHKSNPCGSPSCGDCGVYPSDQCPSPQSAGYGSPQALGSGQAEALGSGQAYAAPAFGTGQT